MSDSVSFYGYNPIGAITLIVNNFHEEQGIASPPNAPKARETPASPSE
jgi:hypothetical protein